MPMSTTPTCPVVEVAYLLEDRGLESVGFIDQKQVRRLAHHGCVGIAVPLGACSQPVDCPPQIADGMLHGTRRIGHSKREEHRPPRPALARWRFPVAIRRGAPHVTGSR